MRVGEVAKRLDVSTSLVYSLIASGKLRHLRVGMGRGCIRINEEQMAEYLRAAEPVKGTAPSPAPGFKLRHLRLP
jgi:excisionase family DNA binding protein